MTQNNPHRDPGSPVNEPENEPNSTPDRADDSRDPARLDETVRMDDQQDLSAGASDAGRPSAFDSSDSEKDQAKTGDAETGNAETGDAETGDAETGNTSGTPEQAAVPASNSTLEPATGQSTLDPPSGDSTLVPEPPDLKPSDLKTPDPATPHGTGDPGPTGGADRGGQTDGATQDLDATVRIDAETDDPPADPSRKTVDENAIDQTVAVDAPVDSQRGPNVYLGKADSLSASADSGDADGDSDQEATVQISDRGDMTIAMQKSVMSSPEIGMTINPRELSKQDKTLWDSAVGSVPGHDAGDGRSDLSPAIDRTFSDRAFDRLRQCDVVDVDVDADAIDAADYKLERKLGEGGMGDVFKARQESLDRMLALKLIKPLAGRKRAQLKKAGRLEAVEAERRQQFLSEAIVTGDLDHPNIVPIHDVALTSNGDLFYSMKLVTGTPWSEVIKDKSRDENLEILLKAADAVGFAHTRHVVHRDIKPENIMLGSFGVVMVMDWGLALPIADLGKPNSIFKTSGLGGTPAFMAPEMATGPIENIGTASDIYLLGATLFMIVAGYAPHQAKNVTECLQAVRSNKIRDVPQEKHDELLDIALKAMASRPQDRYPNVESFQQAIRDYRAHSESISLAARATEDLQRGKESGSYDDFSRAAYRFDEAIKSWSGNERAREGLAETKLAHAGVAYNKGDFDLGLSLLSEEVPEHQPVIRKLRSGIEERDSRETRLAAIKKVAVGMAAVLLVVVSGAAIWIDLEKREAEYQRDLAEVAKVDADKQRIEAIKAQESEQEQRVIAEQKQEEAERARVAAEQAQEEERRQRELAVTARQMAEEAQRVAEQARQAESEQRVAAENARQQEEKAKLAEEQQRRVAEEQRDVAKKERANAQYEAYVSRIGLAKARLERNEAQGAYDILKEIRQESPEAADSWEWRWLWRQANQAKSSEPTKTSVNDLSLSPSGRQGAITLIDGSVDRLWFGSNGNLTQRRRLSDARLAGATASSVAVSPDGQATAIGTESGAIVVHASTGSVILNGHSGVITDLKYTASGLLISGSADKSVRVWNPQNGVELTRHNACWHLSPVRQIAVSGEDSQLTLAVASSDSSTGRIVIWNLRRKGDRVDANRRGTMSEHKLPTTAVAISPDGQWIASGDRGGNALLWNPLAVQAIDYAGPISEALDAIRDKRRPERTKKSSLASAPQPLIDSSFDAGRRLVATDDRQQSPSRAHDDGIKAIDFSQDGQSIVTSSDDYTLKVWDTDSRRLHKTLKGHGGWVVGAGFLGGESDVIVSASNDATVRSWQPDDYIGAFVAHQLGDDPSTTAARQKQAHEDEIDSASFSPDGRKVVTASHDHTARVLQLDPETLAFRQVAQMDDTVLDEGTSFVAMSMRVDRPNRRLYIGSADAMIRIWNLDLGTEISSASGTGLNTSFAISQEGRLMLTGSSSPDVKAKLWRLDPTGVTAPQLIHRVRGHEEAVTAFAISPDESLFYTGDRGGYGILWDADTGQPVGAPVEMVRGYRINAASFSADGRELLIAADDRQLTTLDVETRQVVSRFNHEGAVTQLSLSTDGRHALTVSELATESRYFSQARLWDLRSGTFETLAEESEPRSLESAGRIQRRITSARFDPQGSRIAIARAQAEGDPARVQIWRLAPSRDSETGRELRTQGRLTNTTPLEAKKLNSFELPERLGTAEWVLPLGDRFLLTMNKNGAFRWDVLSSDLVKSYRAHAEITEACFSFDAKYVVTASRSVKVWDAQSGKALAKLEQPQPVRSVQFAPVAKGATGYVLATGGDDGIARTWQWNPDDNEFTLRGKREPQGDADQVRTIRRIRFSPKSDRLLVVGDQGMAHVWNLDQPQQSLTLEDSGDNSLICGDFSRDGRCVAAGGADRKLRIWQLPQPGQPVEQPITLAGHVDQINDVKLLGDAGSGLRAMTASSDDTAKIWDPRLESLDEQGAHPGGREIMTLRQHVGDVTSVDVLSDGRLMLTAGRDGAVILWPADLPAR